MSSRPSVAAAVLQPCSNDYCRTAELSISSTFTEAPHKLSDVSMTASKSLDQLRTLADRLNYALDLEKKSQNEVEKQAGLGTGMFSRYANGKRGGTTVNIDKLVALADVLHVRAEWLVLGNGPVRRGGRDTTPAEEAMTLARLGGTPEEVWQATWDRFRDRADSMTALDWAAAIHQEAALLAKAAAHRVEALDTGVPLVRVDRLLPPPKPAPSQKPRRGSKP